MPKTREIVVAPGAGFTSILAQLHCRAWRIDEPTTAHGIDYQLNEDAFATTHSNVPGQSIGYGNPIPEGNAFGPVLGTPGFSSGGNTVPQTTLVKVRTTDGVGETIRFVEFE